MINIKSYIKPKNSSNTNSTVTSAVVNNDSSQPSPAENWFYYNNDTNSVVCRYDFYSVGNVSAYGEDKTESVNDTAPVDNLTSTSTTRALSANQGRVLKSLIDNATTSSGGTVTTIDWSNVTNKPTAFTPSTHTHRIAEVINLQRTLYSLNSANTQNTNNIASHTNNSSAHLSADDRNKLNNLTNEQIQFLVKLMNIITIDNNNITFNKNVVSTGNVVANNI